MLQVAMYGHQDRDIPFIFYDIGLLYIRTGAPWRGALKIVVVNNSTRM